MSRFLLNGQDLYGNAPQTGDKVSVVDTEGIVGQAGSTTNSQALFDGVAGDLCDVRTDLSDKVSYADNAVLGAKNLLPNNATSQTEHGVTFTVNSDGSVNVSGTASGGNGFITLGTIELKQGVQYILSGGVSGNLRIDIRNADFTMWTNNTASQEVHSPKESFIDTFTPNNTEVVYVCARAQSGSTVSGTLYPMIRLATDTDDTYAPYAMTNAELTEQKCSNSVVAPVENGATASQAYSIGQHFIRDGAFCTAKTAIASGASFTLNTNCTASTVGDNLKTVETKVVNYSGRFSGNQVGILLGNTAKTKFTINNCKYVLFRLDISIGGLLKIGTYYLFKTIGSPGYIIHDIGKDTDIVIGTDMLISSLDDATIEFKFPSATTGVLAILTVMGTNTNPYVTTGIYE